MKYEVIQRFLTATIKNAYLQIENVDVDNKDLLKEIVIETCKGLPNKK